MAPSAAWNAGWAEVNRGTFGFQPVTAPDSEAKMYAAGPLSTPLLTTKSAVPLKTCPVGDPPGIVTLNGALIGLPLTSPVYTSLTPVPWDDAQNASGPTTRPQALTRVGSVIGATPGWSETRSVAR